MLITTKTNSSNFLVSFGYLKYSLQGDDIKYYIIRCGQG